MRQGEFDAAIAVLARGFATSESVPLLRPPIAADLGLAYARCGRIAEGLSHLDAAVEGATKMGRFSRLPLLLAKCGEIHLLAGEPDEADAPRRRLRCASRPSRRSAATRSMRRTCSPRLPRSGGASAEAERHYLDALALATELGMRPLAAHCHAGLARLYARDRQAEKAAEHWTNALFDVPRHGDVVLARAARKGQLAEGGAPRKPKGARFS